MKRALIIGSLLASLFIGERGDALAQVAAPISVGKTTPVTEAKPVKEAPVKETPAKETAGKETVAKAKKPTSAFGNFGASKEPVRIDAASLQVIDKEQKAIYTGDVVAIQGQSTLRCSKLTIYYSQTKKDEKDASAPSATGSSIKKLDCDGPVSVVSTTQTATGDHGLFDAERETVTLTGNVVLADCENVQRGDKLVYNMRTGIANVTNNGNRRVQGVFTPGSDDKDAGSAKKAGCKDKPKSDVKVDSGKAESGKADGLKLDGAKTDKK